LSVEEKAKDAEAPSRLSEQSHSNLEM